jgi:hypothetical protein
MAANKTQGENQMPKLDQDDKMQYLAKAIEICKASATVSHTPQQLAEIIQTTYDKMIGIAENI